jgi:ubiquitin-protein ligase
MITIQIGGAWNHKIQPQKQQTGEICLDILKSEWTPAWTLESICVAISSLLTNPEPSSPLNCDAGKVSSLKNDRIDIVRDANMELVENSLFTFIIYP